MIRYIKTLNRTKEGGSCSNCDKSYNASDGKRVLAGYDENGSEIVEPFNLCNECHDEIIRQRKL